MRLGILAALACGAASTHAASLVAYWDFEKVEADGVSIKSKVGPYVAKIQGSGTLTSDGRVGGGKAWDGAKSGNNDYLLIDDGEPNPMTEASVDDQATVVLWQKNNANVDSSSFWAVAAIQNRGWQFHIPWSNGRVYFDTEGCCGATQRIDESVTGVFPEHDWTGWHHYAFVKDGEKKIIYVDGNVLKEQDGFAPLETEWVRLTIGGADKGSPPDGIIDDFAIFKGALTQDEIKKLAGGLSPGGTVKDTDGDGMPDDFETANGFNPNDPSDAAKDFDKDGVSNLDEYKAGTNPIDVTPPVLTGAAATASFDSVVVTFSENVDPTVAADVSHYSISPALNITGATVKKNTVTLTTAKQTPGATKYTLTVNGVVDGSKNPVAANSTAVFYSFLTTKDGVLKFSYWGGIGGNPVSNLTDDPRYPGEPDMVGAVYRFNSRDIFPDDSHDSYGATIEGYVTPTEAGDYDFFLASDDASQLYVSTDASPDNLQLVAEETGCCNAFQEPGSPRTTAAPLTLKAGQKYFIRAIYKEGGGGDWAQVAWRKTTDTTPAASLPPIPSKFISSAVDLPAPPEGAFTQITPGRGAKGVSPVTHVTIAHRDGKTAWTSSNVSLRFDDVAVTPTFTKDGNVLTVDYNPGLLVGGSTHKVTLNYLDAGGIAATLEYNFTVLPWTGPTKDKVAGYPGLLQGSAVYTDDAGGHTGKAGDYGINLTTKGGPVATYDAAFLAAANAATANDELTVAFWQKKLDTSDSSAFTLNSPSAGNNRGFHAHVPWSNQNVYFDTVGCCDGTTQRITADINTFPDYTTGDPRDNLWWTTQWHFWVFTKKADQKNIWIDGKLFLNGSSSNPLKTDHNAFYMGSGANATELSHAIIDDFAVFGKELTEAQVVALSKGTSPTTIPSVIAFWDFNDKSVKPVDPPTLSVSRNAEGKIVLTFQGTLQASITAGSGYVDVAGTSPLVLDGTGAAKFYRAVVK